MIKKLPTTLLILFMCGIAYAAPVIDSTSGTLSDGESVVLSGSTFGTKTDNGGAEAYLNLKWTDFDSDSAITDVFGASANGTLSTSGNRTGSTKYFARTATTDNGMGVAVSSSSTNDGYYSAFWLNTFSNDYDTPALGQIKIWRIFTNGVDDPYPNITTGYLGGGTQSGIASTENGVDNPFNEFYSATYINNSNWHFVEVWFKPSANTSTATGEYVLWIDGAIKEKSFTAETWSNANSNNTFNGSWRTVPFFRDAGVDQAADEVYYDYEQARCIITDASDLTSSGNFAIQPMTSHSSSSITINSFNQGSFANDATTYLHVWDENGVKSNALEITIGGSAPTPSPDSSSYGRVSVGRISSGRF